MTLMVVAHPIPGFNGRVFADEVAMAFVGGFAVADVPTGVQADLTARGFTLNATPGTNYGGKYVLDEDLRDPDSQASVSLRAAYGTFHNVNAILGTDSSQWPAQLEAAFAGYPGETFFFPDGNYGLARGITVSHDNSLVLAPNARIYATAATSILINHETSADLSSGNFHLLPQNRTITGGWLDGAGLAGTVLRCAVFQGLKVENIRITDGINRGLVVDKIKLGTSGPNMTAEGIFRGLNFMQTTTANLTDNVAVEVLASDCHFEDIIVIDWTTAVRDAGYGLWQNVHVWLSQAARYPTSVAFDMRSGSRMDNAYSDTYRTGWLIAANSGATLQGPLFILSPEFVDSATNAANPATIFHLADSTSSLYVRGGNLRNYAGATGAAQATFIVNPTANTNIDGVQVGNYSDSQNLVPGAPGSYYRGRLLGRNADWTPAIVGEATAGTATYSNQQGWLVIDRNSARLTMQIGGTFDSTIAGQLLIFTPLNTTLATVARIGSNQGFPSQLMAHMDPGSGAIRLYDQSTANTSGGGSSAVDGTQVHGGTFWLELDIELDIAYFTGNGSD